MYFALDGLNKTHGFLFASSDCAILTDERSRGLHVGIPWNFNRATVPLKYLGVRTAIVALTPDKENIGWTARSIRRDGTRVRARRFMCAVRPGLQYDMADGEFVDGSLHLGMLLFDVCSCSTI